MKKYRLTILAILVLALLSGCGINNGLNAERRSAIEEETGALYGRLEESYLTAESFSTMKLPLLSFADENEIYYREQGEDGLILIQHSPDGEDARSITLHCSLNADTESTRLESARKAAVLLGTMKTQRSHCRITLLFTDGSKSYPAGAVSMPEENLVCDNLINVIGSDEPKLYTKSVGSNICLFHRDAETDKVPEGKTYEIKLEGILPPESGDGPDDEEYPNAILTLYQFLSWCESNHIDYRLVSFTGGSDTSTYPDSATLVLAVGTTDTNKFRQHFYSVRNGFVSDYEEAQPNAAFTITELAPATEALSSACTTELSGLLYTLSDNFEYLEKNEKEEVVGINTPCRINVTPKDMNLYIRSRYLEESIDHVLATFEELASLTGFTAKETGALPCWVMPEITLLERSFENAADSTGFSPKKDTTFRLLESSVFYKKTGISEQLVIGVDEDSMADLVETLVVFMESFDLQ